MGRVVAAGPNWLGSPQHTVVGAAAALVIYCFCRRSRTALPIWAAVSIAIGAVSAAEIAWEVGEYYVRYRGHFHYSAYYDTLADMANSAVGAFVGALLGLPIAARLPRRHS